MLLTSQAFAALRQKPYYDKRQSSFGYIGVHFRN